MLPIYIPFELDRESMILRNNEMYKHYNILNKIEKRKNIYLPKIQLQRLAPNKIKNNNNNLNLLSSIEKENEKLNNKIIQINMRPNQKSINAKIINNLLKQRKHTRDNTRKIKLNLLLKTNNEIKNRIKNVHPFINNKKLKLEYLESRRIYLLNRKLKPCLSWGNSYFTKEDYSYIKKFDKKLSERNDYNKSHSNNSSSSKDIIKLKKIKFKKLGLSMSSAKIK